MIELEQTISELRRIGRQQSQQIATMQQIQINTQNWSIVATEHISSNGNISGQLGGKIGKQKEKVIVEEEERELVGIVSVRPKVARKWINNIVNGYMHEHRWQQQLLSPVVPYRQVSSTKSPVTAKNNNNNNSGNDIYFINWEDAASIRRCAERWAALTAVELVIEEKIQDHLRIYRLWKTSQAIMNA
ncbi:hypothetical protein BDF19DRAFT_456346 [Syncephalis fuscata]|nr:hypothetical protein BDF19DRAFT_456346 [Syncephalis fuscata]